MLLLIHIIIGLVSLLFATYVVLQPSHTRLKIGISLVAATLLSGTYLALLNPSHLAPTCITGLVYLSIATTILIIAKSKLTVLHKT